VTPKRISSRKLIDLEAQGLLSSFCQASALNIRRFIHKKIVLYYHALLAGPAYANQPMHRVWT
jgi:hypothetical protein